MRSVIFDTGPLISLVTNNLLWILEPLKERFKGEFYITPAVKKELIDKAFSIKRFEFEAFQTSSLLNKGILELVEHKELNAMTNKLMDLANQSFKARGKYIKIVSRAEIESLAADALLDASTTVVDERTVRLLLENSPNLTNLMENRMHTKITPNKDNIREFKRILSDVQIIRTSELVTVAYKAGLFKDYLVSSDIIKNPRKDLLDAMLWAVKVRGCGISKDEIDAIVDSEAK